MDRERVEDENLVFIPFQTPFMRMQEECVMGKWLNAPDSRKSGAWVLITIYSCIHADLSSEMSGIAHPRSSVVTFLLLETAWSEGRS